MGEDRGSEAEGAAVAAVAPVGGLTGLSLAAAAQLVAAREVSPVELTAAAIARAEALEPRLNVYITRTFETALASAGAAAAEIAAAGGPRSPLHGIPLTLKDNVETAGVRTTAGSRSLQDHVPRADAHLVSRLRAAGAVILGKLTLHERGMGGTNVNPDFGTPHNPWALDRITGGSSGGSAAAVAAGFCYASLGTDSRGSVRIPAALCGVTGLKPTYGRVSIRGLIPYCWSLDHAGPLARSAEDTALVLGTIAGFDPLDPTSVDRPVPDFGSVLSAGSGLSLVSSVSPTNDGRRLRIGVPRDYFFDAPDVDPEVAAIVLAAAAKLGKLGAVVTEIGFPDPPRYLDDGAFEAEAAASCASSLRDGGTVFGPDVRARLLKAQAVTGAEYARARWRQVELKRELDQVFERVDLVLTPTCPVTAPRIDEVEAGAGASLSLSRNTRVFNTAGLPTISVPCGLSAAGLPVGMSLTGGAWEETTVLAAAHAYQSASDWHRRSPAAIASLTAGRSARPSPG
jgi:aspartyl-tRNA(Asn)/glutamyl-tRNA(Gln) amidotransferase subunit A